MTKAEHLDLRSRDIPSPSHVSDIMKANPSPKKSVGKDITSPMKEMTKGGGKMGGHSHGKEKNEMLDRMEKSMLGLVDNQETLC